MLLFYLKEIIVGINRALPILNTKGFPDSDGIGIGLNQNYLEWNASELSIVVMREAMTLLNVYLNAARVEGYECVSHLPSSTYLPIDGHSTQDSCSFRIKSGGKRAHLPFSSLLSLESL